MHYQIIIQKIQEQDPSCLEVLYNQYGTRLYSYCIRQWDLDEDTAWEAVYQTLEAVITKGSRYSFDSETHFNNFLFKVLLNFIRQHYRKNKVAKPDIHSVDMHSDDALPYGLQPVSDEQYPFGQEGEDTADGSLLKQVTAALAKLDSTDRDVLLLKSQNYTYDEIATMLKIENNQLKVKHHRAKQKLLQQLKNMAAHENR